MSDTEGDTTMIDEDAAREEHMMYGKGDMTEQQWHEKYPNRPHNHSKTPPFSDLYLALFNPLRDNQRKPAGSKQRGGKGSNVKSQGEIRDRIIDRFIARWRKDVGNDIFPAFRLIMPDKDRDRTMYGLKEAAIGKLLVKIMKITKDSEDGYSLLHWKLPGMRSSSALAGDFPARCHEVISKRPMRTTPGNMSIAEVNELLDTLGSQQKEEHQRPIIEEFYNRMNAEELKWLIRIILRQIKIGATEKTILDRWHPDAENLFNISSSLRRVCWELHDPKVSLEGDAKGINLMQCFQPQLAAFQMRTMEQMVKRMKTEEGDDTFWIQEKIDGERMQLHMMRDDNVPGGFRFSFWSRKAKDYTYLYGEGFEQAGSALTKHLKGVFADNVQNIILDGEMMGWNMDLDRPQNFGHLKTAALEEQGRGAAPAFEGGARPVYRVFDCLYLNGKDLTSYTLRIRYEVLESAVKPLHRRLEILGYTEARDPSEIEPKLREVVADKSEGLVLKNPRSAYRLNDRNDDWIKVKPEYMTEFGEALDCVIIGGYYGSGKRGGGLSSFLCGLRVDQEHIDRGDHPQKCYSFFKVGGGFSAADYADIRHRTDGKWMDWNYNAPPTEFISLGGTLKQQFERPDVWIKPEDSVVLEVKAAEVTSTNQFASNLTLRFPRFKRIRTDKTWQQALSKLEFEELRRTAEEERKEKKFKVDDARKKRSARKRKRELVIQGQETQQEVDAPFARPATKVFENMKFFVMTDALKPLKKSKAEIEAFVKANGGTVVASESGASTKLVADRNLIKVASITKRGQQSIMRPRWLYDQVAQTEKDNASPNMPDREEAFLLPIEMKRHAYFAKQEDEERWEQNVDEHGDSYYRDLEVDELEALLASMPEDAGTASKADKVLDEIIGNGQERLGRGMMFYGLKAYFEGEDTGSSRKFEFAGGEVADSLQSEGITHVVIPKSSGKTDEIRAAVSRRRRMPHIVTPDWILACWAEGDRRDEEGYGP
ncbi:hypothetical protein Q7P37_001788 [Cladosporium fusiforme]